MAQLPPIRKLYLDDFQSQKSWIGPFLLTLNTFINSIVSALTQDLTLIDNTTSDIKYVTLSSVPTPTKYVSIEWTKDNGTPVAVIVGNVGLSNNASPVITSAVQIQWQMSSDNKSIQITNVIGIVPTNTTQYVLTLICIVG